MDRQAVRDRLGQLVLRERRERRVSSVRPDLSDPLALRDRRVPQVRRVQPVRGQPDLPVPWVSLAPQVRRDLRAFRASAALLDFREMSVLPALLGQIRPCRDLKVRLACRDHREIRGSPDPPDLLESRVRLAPQEHPVRREPKDLRDPLVPLARTGLTRPSPVQPVLLDQQDRRVLMAHR